MSDLPQHASQVTLLRDMLQGGFRYESEFRINWLTPYLFGYFLIYVLVPFVGVVTACKIVIASALAAVPPATAFLMGEAGVDRRWAFLTIPGLYGWAYHWGFLNFLVAVPIGLLFVALVLRQAKQPTPSRACAVALGINLLFFCHALTCVFFGAIAGVVAVLSARRVRTGLMHILPLASVLPTAVVWARMTIGQPTTRLATRWELNWFTDAIGWGRISGFFPRLLGAWPGPLAMLFGLLIVFLPLAAGGRFKRASVVWAPLIVCVATLLLAPGVLFGTAFTYQRFTALFLPLFLMTIDPPPKRGWPAWTWGACLLLPAGWIGIVATNAVRYDREAAGFYDLVAHMEPGQRVLSFAFERESNAAVGPPFLYFPAWYSALTGGIVDPSAAQTFAPPVLYRPESQPAADYLYFSWEPQTFDWNLTNGARYRYFIAKAPTDMGPSMFRASTCRVQLVYHVNHWWLYEKEQRCEGHS